MAFTKKVNVRNSAAVIKEVNQMLEAGFPKERNLCCSWKEVQLEL